MEDVKFHPAVELVISRMESNPKEFTYEGGKWRHMLEQHTRWMNKEEKEAVNEKLRDINLEHMRLTMMKKILTDKEREVVAGDGGGGYVIGGTTGVTWSSGNSANTLTTSEILSLPQHEKETMLKLIEEYQEQNGVAY